MTSGTGWRDVKIGTLGRVVTGKTPPSAQPELFGDTLPFITPTDIDGVSRTVATDRFISEDGASAFKNQMIPAGAVCFVCIGATIGKMCIATCRSLTNQQVNSIVVDEASHDPNYVFYALRHIAPDVKGLAGGAATPIISKSSFSDISIRVAPLQQQRRIASILSAYDDLIENNTRRIAILEEMARRIYEEWFVRFRFPGHEGVRMVESELGLVPDRWRLLPVTDVAAFKYGKGLSTKHLTDDAPFPVYGASKIIGRYTEYTREDRTLIVGCRGSVGVPQITLPRCFVTNNSFTADPVHPAGQLWLYLLLQSRGLKDVVGGAAQPQITLEGLRGAAVLNPPPPLINQFDALVRPMFQLQWSLSGKNENLRTTRDLLLPKLISGELSVENIEIAREAP